MTRGFARSFEIAGRQVGGGAPCFIIAEAGVNHFGSLDKARGLVDLAKRAGADAVKFQHYRTDRLVGSSAPEWRDRLRTKELADADMAAIAAYCAEQGILFLCTGHEEEAVEFLDRRLGVPAFKVGSGEVQNWPYLADIARRGKPIIISTGLYSLEQIHEALGVLAQNGAREVAVLHCVTAYPADPAVINLDVMRQIREFFEGPVGYSDHTAGTAVPLAAVALGAAVLEKHITLDFDVPNAQDWKVSCGPDDLGKFVADARAIEAARGGGTKTLAETERKSVLWARKSITAATDIPAGSRITAEMLMMQRPGDGLTGEAWNRVVGATATRAIPGGTKVGWDMLGGVSQD
jgi:N-acetylneuraminate synthase/N,N'-diacetyllegionaminate synthase